jgi:hypothetical protein
MNQFAESFVCQALFARLRRFLPRQIGHVLRLLNHICIFMRHLSLDLLISPYKEVHSCIVFVH